MTVTAPRPQPFKRYPDDGERAAVAAGYRHLANLIESGVAPVPIGPQVDLFLTRIDGEEQASAARDLMRALGGGKYDKEVHGTSMQLVGMCGGLPVQIWIDRGSVCERVVTGTREVVEQVRVGEDPRPVETVTHTEDVVEWICSPLLAADATQPAEVSA